MGANLAMVQRGVSLGVLLLLASTAQGEYRHGLDGSRRESKRSILSVASDEGLVNVPHLEIDTAGILPPPTGFEPYMEYGGTFKMPADPGATPDYFDPAKLQAKGIHTVDAFLSNPDLPDIFKKRVVSIRTTGSTHKSDDMHPRFLLHNYEPGGRSVDNHPLDIIGVGTDPNDPNVNQIERITYNPLTRKFVFSALDLSKSPPEVLDTEICKKCHTEHLRPNFDPAHNWPSAIGVRERFNIFDKGETELMQKMHDENPIAKKHFTMDALVGKNEQSPATVLFYALFGPVQAYVSDNMVKNQQYDYNKLSVVKVLANCKDEIKSLKDRAPAFFNNKRLEISRKVPKFNFQVNDKGEQILNAEGKQALDYEPVLVEEYTDQITALVSLLKTNTDPDEIGWLGKTSKIKEMYTHAFSKQDFDMLIGGICERDESVKNLLIKHGANANNPCYDKGNASRDLCSEPSVPPAFQAPVVSNAVKELDSSKVDACVRNFGGQPTRTYCVGEGVEQRNVMFNDKLGFYFCKNDPNVQSCPGQEMAVDPRGADMILDNYAKMEQAFQRGERSGGLNTYRNNAQREIALRAAYQLRGKSLEAVARGGEALPSTTVTNLQRCAYQGTQGYCYNDNGTLRLVRWEPSMGFQYCVRSEVQCDPSDRQPLPEAAREALLGTYKATTLAAEQRNPASITTPAQQTAAQRIFYHYNGKGPVKATARERQLADGTNPNPNQPNPNNPANPDLNQPNPRAPETGGLQAARIAAAKIMDKACFSCHQSSPQNDNGGKDAFPFPNRIDADFMASITGRANSIMQRVNSEDPDTRMPPEASAAEKAEIRRVLGAWVQAEMAGR